MLNPSGYTSLKRQGGSVGLLPMFVVSLLLHLLVFAVFTFGWQGSTVTPVKTINPKYVKAQLVQLKPKAKSKKAAPKTPKIVDLTKKKRAQEKARQDARKKAKAKQRAKDAAKKKKLSEAKKRKDQLAKEKAARDKAEKLKAAKQLEVEKEQQRRETLDRELAAEEAELEQELQAEQDEVLVLSQTAIIKRKIESNWSRPPSARKGMECILSIQLVPTGRVTSVTVIKSSGSAAFDLSAQSAVKKAEQFPDLKSLPPEVFERQFRRFQLRFNPKDLRL